MAVKSRFTLEGLEEYLEKVQQAGKDVDQAADKALSASGALVLTDMQRRIPVDTGFLSEHLFLTDPVRDGNYHFVELGLNLKDRNALYGVFQEYGTSSMAAQPFIRPAFDENKKKISDVQKRVLMEEGLL